MKSNIPVFNISNFDDYNNCMKFDKSFYIRNFKEHVTENLFVEKPHGHDFYLILLITKGNGKHIIDFRSYDVFPGAMYIISPGQIHQWNLSLDINGCILFFTKEFFLQDFNYDHLEKFPFFNSTFSIPFLKLDKAETKNVLSFYHMIHTEYEKRQINYQEVIRMHLNTLFINLTRFYKSHHLDSIQYNYDLIQLNRYEALVDTYYKEHKPITFYAKSLHITERQLNYLCKKTVNKKPSEVLIDRVILEAKRLIIHSNLSIVSIANQLNYNDSSYFNRLFKKTTKQTPQQFRNEQYNQQ